MNRSRKNDSMNISYTMISNMDFISSLQIREQLQSPVDKTEYLALVNEDMLYMGNINRLKNVEFQIIIRKITRDLQILLHFKYDDFWRELQISKGLKKCLESCLRIFPRKNFGSYINKKDHVPSEVKQSLSNLSQNQHFKIYEQLMKTVLFIYHRIICDSKQPEKDNIYNEWLMDIPKLLNLISIYKDSNPKIVRKIIESTFEIEYYANDVSSFINFIERTLLQSLDLDLEFVFTKKVIFESTNFDNPTLSFTRNLVKSFFRIFDTYSILCDFLVYFPMKFTKEFLESNSILDYIEGYFKYIENINGKWQMSSQFLNIFGPTIEQIRQKIIEFILLILDLYWQCFNKNIPSWHQCLKVYMLICQYFGMQIQKKENKTNKQFFTLLRILLEEVKQRNVFFYNPNWDYREDLWVDKKNFNHSESFYQKQKDSQEKPGIYWVKFCTQWEQKQRQKNCKNGFDSSEILEMLMNNIKSYRQWRQFQQDKNHDFFDSDHVINQTFKTSFEDSILNQLQKPIKQFEQTVQNENSAHILEFDNKQYNDEPQEIQDPSLEEKIMLFLDPIKHQQLDDNDSDTQTSGKDSMSYESINQHSRNSNGMKKKKKNTQKQKNLSFSVIKESNFLFQKQSQKQKSNFKNSKPKFEDKNNDLNLSFSREGQNILAQISSILKDQNINSDIHNSSFSDPWKKNSQEAKIIQSSKSQIQEQQSSDDDFNNMINNYRNPNPKPSSKASNSSKLSNNSKSSLSHKNAPTPKEKQPKKQTDKSKNSANGNRKSEKSGFLSRKN